MLHNSWLLQLAQTKFHGEEVGPRGQATLELLDQAIEFDAPHCLIDVPARKLNFRFAVAEFIWMMTGHSDVSSIAQYNSVIAQYSDDGIFFAGAYGPHILGAWPRIIHKFRQDPFTRQAVIVIPRPHKDTKDEPCTLTFDFLQRPLGTLNLIATMRSNDLWLGLPYDAFNFAQLLNCLCGKLQLTRGWVKVRAASSHLYARNLEDINHVLQHSDGNTIAVDRLPDRPPAWVEHVLVHRDLNYPGVPEDGNDPWVPYVGALMARTSDEARDLFRRAANGQA